MARATECYVCQPGDAVAPAGLLITRMIMSPVTWLAGVLNWAAATRFRSEIRLSSSGLIQGDVADVLDAL
jgi:hypothetical protein